MSSKVSNPHTTKTKTAKLKNSTMKKTTKVRNLTSKVKLEALARKKLLNLKEVTKRVNLPKELLRNKHTLIANIWLMIAKLDMAISERRNMEVVALCMALIRVLMNIACWDTKKTARSTNMCLSSRKLVYLNPKYLFDVTIDYYWIVFFITNAMTWSNVLFTILMYYLYNCI